MGKRDLAEVLIGAWGLEMVWKGWGEGEGSCHSMR